MAKENSLEATKAGGRVGSGKTTGIQQTCLIKAVAVCPAPARSSGIPSTPTKMPQALMGRAQLKSPSSQTLSASLICLFPYVPLHSKKDLLLFSPIQDFIRNNVPVSFSHVVLKVYGKWN